MPVLTVLQAPLIVGAVPMLPSRSWAWLALLLRRQLVLLVVALALTGLDRLECHWVIPVVRVVRGLLFRCGVLLVLLASGLALQNL